MAEVIIKASVSQGEVIAVSYNKKKDNLIIKVEKTKQSHEESV